MKRSIFVATLALTPALLHAQANVPAQTALQARVTAPAALMAVKSNDTTPKVRVSTGVVAPKLLNPIVLPAATAEQTRILGNTVTMVVTLMVDATGKPSNIAISQPAAAGLDEEVLAALNQARFKPGTLDGEPYALPVRLNVVIERGAAY